MTHMVTRCPTCATAFRVTSTQLESAKGAVRCGSCLHIFQAQDFLVKTAEEESSANVKAIPSESQKADSKAGQPKSGPVVTHQKPELASAKKPEPVIVQQKSESGQPKTIEPKQEPEKPKAPAAESVKAVPPKAEPIAKKVAASTPAATSGVQPSADAKPTVVKSASAQTPAKATTVAKQVVIDKAKILADEDDILISDDMDKANEKPAGYEFDGFIDLDLNPKQTVSLFEREIRYEPPRDITNEPTTDESWAEGLLNDDEPVHQFKKPVKTQDNTSTEETGSAAEPKISNNSDTKYSGPLFSLVSETSAEDSADGKQEPFFSEAFLNATRAPEPAKESNNFAAALFEQEADGAGYSDEANDSGDSEKSSRRPVKSSKMRAFDTSRAALLMNIMPAPVEFTARRMRKYQRKLWPILAVCMSLLLLLQIAYFKFDYFSRVEPFRTAYLFVCPLVGCEVPALVDTSQILATNLIVRNHPDTPNALMVDAILINNAPFEQPFPDLILSFSKLDETPVASRRFTPKEYIAGEIAGMKYIPQQQPVHIKLEISDPGPEAVNYTLATH